MEKTYNLSKITFLRTLITILIILFGINSYASHIVGADLFYTHVTGNTYKITFVAYGDCGPSSATSFATLPNAQPLICIYNGGTYVTSISLIIDTPGTPYAGKEITPVCPSDTNLTQCTSTSYSIPGIKKFVYTGTYTVPSTSHYWRFLFTGSMGSSSGAGRAAAITNIAGGTSIELVDTLDNTYHNNSSPALTIVPTPFFCLNEPDSYNPGAVDPDSDSLSFALVTGRSGTSNCTTPGSNVTYVGGHSATAPLSVSAGTFSFSNANGQINFTPNVTQRGLVVYNVEEYRNDTFIGTSQREMTFLVLTCSGTPPSGGFTGVSTGTLVDSLHYNICADAGAFSITLTPTEADTSNKIYVIASSLPTGSTFTTVNDSTNHPTCTFNWTTTGVTPGTYNFIVTYKDNSCPLYGTKTVTYTIVINPLPPIDAGPTVSICIGNSTTLTAAGGSGYVWAAGGTLSCTSCTSPVATPSSTTIYTVTGTSAAGCVNTDTVTVIVNPLPAAITGITTVCVGNTSTLADSTTGGSWRSTTTSVATIGAATGIAGGVAGGTSVISYTLPTGCYATTTFTVNPLPGAITGPSTVCAGSQIIQSESSTGGTWSSSDTSIATIDASGVLSGISAGTVTISYTLPTGCYVTTSIVVNPMPTAIGGPTALCVGNTITLTDSVSGGTWTSSSTAIATVTGTTGVVSGVSGGAVTITYTLRGGCYVTYAVTVNPLPAAIGGPTSVCVGSTITITESTGGGTWSSSNTAKATIDATGVVTGVASGTATMTYTLATGCYITATITVNPLPASIGGPSTVCVASTITLTESSSGGTWTSTSAGIATIAGASGVLGGVSAGTDVITYTLPTGCLTSTTITVNPLPDAGAISGATSICVGNTATMTESVSTGTWSVTNTHASISATGTVTASSAGIDTVVYTVTNSCGTATATHVVTIVATPYAGTITGATSVCIGATITLFDSVSGGTWSSSATGVATVAGGVVTGVSAGSATISFSYTNACGTAVTTAAITVLPLPTISVTPPAPAYCVGNDVSLTAGGAVSYSWSPATALSSTAGATVIATPATTITYIVTGTGSNGCLNTGSVTVTVHPLPTVVVSPETICYGFNTNLTATGASTYSWSPTIGLSSGVGATVTANPTSTITYTITGVDAFGCVNSTTATVTVNPIPPAPNVTTPVTYCKNAIAIPLTAGGVNLLWYINATGGIGSTTAPTPPTTTVSTTEFYLSQTVNGCESPRDSIEVIVLEDAITGFNFSIKYGCTRDTVTFVNTSQFCAAYLWDFGDGAIFEDTVANPVHYYPSAHVDTNYFIKLIGYNSTCFSDSTIETLLLTPDPNPPFVLTGVSDSQVINYGSSVQLNSNGGTRYYWTPNDGSLTNPNINNPIATPTVSTTYEVYSYNEDGCLDSASVYVKVNFVDSDFISSAFTPNGDGNNDVFKISHLRFDRLVDFRIFNRWGQLVFQTSDFSKGWDGTFEGVPQDIGVYNYMVITAHSDGSNQYYKGTVTLIR